MSQHRQVWETLATLLQRVERTSSSPALTATDLDGLKEEVRKLGKTQFKANTIAENQATRFEEAIALLKETQTQKEQLLEKAQQNQQLLALQTLLQTLLPAVDGLENAIDSGQKYLILRDRAAANPMLSPEQRQLLSPADRAALASWLDGLRLVHERLLLVLAAGDVNLVPTVGQLFDPFLHRAVGVTNEGYGPAGTIVGQERAGYQSPAGVLRYADVIVYKPTEPNDEEE